MEHPALHQTQRQHDAGDPDGRDQGQLCHPLLWQQVRRRESQVATVLSVDWHNGRVLSLCCLNTQEWIKVLTLIKPSLSAGWS